MIVMGIDNGLDGAVAWVDGNKHSGYCVMPTQKTTKSKRILDAGALAIILKEIGPDHVFLERAHAMPGQGVTSMFSIGYGYGVANGILASLQIPHTIVSAKTWQKEMFLGVNVQDTKCAAALICKRLWPDKDLLASPRCKVPHDGICDALLIAEYGRRTVA